MVTANRGRARCTLGAVAVVRRPWHDRFQIVSNEKLTRQELSWLLAQEARGAAKALREGVTALSKPPPAGDMPAPPVETSLDALDDAIGRLGELQLGQSNKARRGRIDLAALLCDIAPSARIAMEPGAGTEVFGEEAELRRMLHLLVSQTNTGSGASGELGGSGVEIRRHGEWVKISVELGPDASPTAELERRWLSRMAVRHGGRLELEGGVQTMWLPADGASDQREVAALRKELEQAQQLGEAYARELAQVFTTSDATQTEATPGFDEARVRFETLLSTLATLARTMRAWLDGTRATLDADAAARDTVEAMRKRLSRGQDQLSAMEQIAACPLTEKRRLLRLGGPLARGAVQYRTASGQARNQGSYGPGGYARSDGRTWRMGPIAAQSARPRRGSHTGQRRDSRQPGWHEADRRRWWPSGASGGAGGPLAAPGGPDTTGTARRCGFAGS